MVVSVGIDVSKDKHDCFIVSSDGEVLADVFTIPNTMDGFHCLLQRIRDCITPQDKIKVLTICFNAALFSAYLATNLARFTSRAFKMCIRDSRLS